MRRAFEKVMRRFEPDLIVLLGDLFDENVQMKEDELSWTIERFRSVFPIPISGHVSVSVIIDPLHCLGHLFARR